MEKLKNVTVIVRSVEERTEQKCLQLLSSEIRQQDLFTVHEAPFSIALEHALRIGIKQDKKWTICIDADVLISKQAINILVDFADKLPKSTFKVVPYFVDKFFGTYREGGIHCYRSDLLPRAISYIPEEGINLRPESKIYLEMKNAGYETVVSPFLLAIHDYEQYYKDIFRKTYIYAHKWQHWISEFIGIWRGKADSDKDFRIALSGLAAGIAMRDEVRIDKNQVPYDLMQTLDREPFKEKTPLDGATMEPGAIEKIIQSHISEFNEKIVPRYPEAHYFNQEPSRSFMFKLVYKLADRIENLGRIIKRFLLKMPVDQ